MKSRKITLNKINQYKMFLIEEEKTAATIEKYIRDIMHFYHYLDQTKLITKESLILYKQSLNEYYKPTSINSMLVAINSFLSFLHMNEYKVKLYKLQKRVFIEQNKELTHVEYKRLLTIAKQRKNEKLNLLMQTICATGIRVSEHQYITVEALKTKNATISNKGKIREILIPKDLRKVLLKYCHRMGIKKGSVFITKNGKPLNRSNIWLMMKKLCEDASVDKNKVYPHNLRHLFAFTYYSVEKNLAHLADILGHSSIETTRIYTKTSMKECEATLNRMGLVLSS